MATARVSAAALAGPGRLRVEVGGCAVLLALVDGVPHAVADGCPHRGTSLADGVVRDGVVTCPAHLWQFDLRSGARHDTRGEGLARYEVSVVGDELEVTVPDGPPARSLREVLLAHARGEE
ncbi:MAG: Rieske 2Fe-2S domain-containing protein [Frankiales bacterium]|nr:Rieske 2Fe-2S domain-containing protein [Frankiales bacterium]